MARFGLRYSLKLAEKRRRKARQSRLQALESSEVMPYSTQYWDQAHTTRSIPKKVFLLVSDYCEGRGERPSERELEFVLWIVEMETLQSLPYRIVHYGIPCIVQSSGVVAMLHLNEWLGLPWFVGILLAIVLWLPLVVLGACIEYRSLHARILAAREALDQWSSSTR